MADGMMKQALVKVILDAPLFSAGSTLRGIVKVFGRKLGEALSTRDKLMQRRRRSPNLCRQAKKERGPKPRTEAGGRPRTPQPSKELPLVFGPARSVTEPGLCGQQPLLFD